jgi:hypothetical protein
LALVVVIGCGTRTDADGTAITALTAAIADLSAQVKTISATGGACYVDMGSDTCADDYQVVKTGRVFVATWLYNDSPTYAGPACFTSPPADHPPTLAFAGDIINIDYRSISAWKDVAPCAICCAR